MNKRLIVFLEVVVPIVMTILLLATVIIFAYIIYNHSSNLMGDELVANVTRRLP